MAVRAGASRQQEVLKAQQERRRGGVSESVRQLGGSVSGSVQSRLQVPEWWEVLLDDLDVVGGLALSDQVQAASKETAASCSLNLRFSCGGADQGLQNHSTS